MRCLILILIFLNFTTGNAQDRCINLFNKTLPSTENIAVSLTLEHMLFLKGKNEPTNESELNRINKWIDYGKHYLTQHKENIDFSKPIKLLDGWIILYQGNLYPNIYWIYNVVSPLMEQHGGYLSRPPISEYKSHAKNQPWLKWNPEKQKYEMSNTGASKSLMNLFLGKNVYRGMQLREFNYLNIIKELMNQKELNGEMIDNFNKIIDDVIEFWYEPDSNFTQLRHFKEILPNFKKISESEQMKWMLILASQLSKHYGGTAFTPALLKAKEYSEDDITDWHPKNSKSKSKSSQTKHVIAKFIFPEELATDENVYVGFEDEIEIIILSPELILKLAKTIQLNN